MIITVVGGAGIVGRTLVEHFEHLGHEVICLERNSRITLGDAVRFADVVFVVTRPISEVNVLLRRAGNEMQPGTLLVHGTSVESPYGEPMNWQWMKEKGITFCHLHFHFRPEIPLRETLRGQHLTVRIDGHDAENWKSWLEYEFVPFQPFIHWLEGNEHDQITSISQLLHMILAYITSRVWQEAPNEILTTGLTIGGPPFRFLARSVLRTASGAGVAAEILECHPETGELLSLMRRAIDELAGNIHSHSFKTIEDTIQVLQRLMPPNDLSVWNQRTSQLIRLEADLQRNNVVFHFTREENQTGLLARVLGEFDKRGVDKTTAIAQTNPDGNCIFIIGVREDSPAVAEAVAAIEDWRKNSK